MTYVKKQAGKKKYELCSEWVLETLTDYRGCISLVELIYIGLNELSYSRQDIYNTLTIIGDKIVRSGHGTFAIWYTKEKYKELGSPNGAEAVKMFLDEQGYETTREYINDQGF